MYKRSVVLLLALLLVGIEGTCSVAGGPSILQHNVREARTAFAGVVNGHVTNSTSISTAFASNVGATNLLIACVFYQNSQTTTGGTMSDSLGNTWSKAVEKQVGSGTNRNGVPTIFYVKNAKGAGADTLTFTPTVPSHLAIWIIEVSGVDTLDTTASASIVSGGNTSITSGSFSTSFANELILAFSSSNDTSSSVGSIGRRTATGLDNKAGDSGGDEYRIVRSIQNGITASYNFSKAATPAGIVVATWH